MEAVSPSLPLDEYLSRAQQIANTFMTESQGKMQGGEYWRTPLFEFCRLAKAHASLAGLRAKLAIKRVEAWLRTQRTNWTSFVGIADEDQGRDEFRGTWDKIRCPAGSDPLAAAVEKARKNPITIPEDWRYSNGYVLFVAVAAWLQQAQPDQPILLPCRKLAKLMGVSAMQISRYREWAVEDGLLIVTKASRYNADKGRGEATEFRLKYRLSSTPVMEAKN
jgi:hypothetical protein